MKKLLVTLMLAGVVVSMTACEVPEPTQQAPTKEQHELTPEEKKKAEQDRLEEERKRADDAAIDAANQMMMTTVILG